jgi:hypothetical protein
MPRPFGRPYSVLLWRAEDLRGGGAAALADNDQWDVTLNNCFKDVGAKVLAKRNVIYVHEDRILAIMDGEAVPNTARHHIGIGASVADRDLWHGSVGRTVALTVPRDEIDSDPILRVSAKRKRPRLRFPGSAL